MATAGSCTAVFLGDQPELPIDRVLVADFPCLLNYSRRWCIRSTRRRRPTCRPPSCRCLRERSPPRPAKVFSFPPATLFLGRLRRTRAKRIGSTEHSWTIPKAMRRPRPANTSLDWPGAVPSQARPSLITFSIPPLPPTGAAGSLTYMRRSEVRKSPIDEISTLTIRGSMGETSS